VHFLVDLLIRKDFDFEIWNFLLLRCVKKCFLFQKLGPMPVCWGKYEYSLFVY